MKILITGGAGYIGTSLIPLLLARNYQVTVFDKLLYGGDALIPFFKNKNFHFIKGDIRDVSVLRNACKGKDIIIHLAAIVGFPACRENPNFAETINVGGTKNLISSVDKNQYVLFGSTGSNYGVLVNKICTEETPLNPLSIYGKTKTKAEQILMEYTNCTAYRFATAFGVSPRLRLDLLINDFTYQAVKQKYLVVYEASFMRTFINVQDIASSFLFAIDNYNNMQGQIYNIGSDNMNYSKKEICNLIAEKTGALIYYADIGKDADQRNYQVSYKKIKYLGFEAKINVQDGIKDLIKVLDVVKLSNPYKNAYY